MFELFLFVGFPYIAFTLMIALSVYRYRTQRFTYSALSSQFLESNQLRWGSLGWHLGILILAVGHIIPVIVPGIWHNSCGELKPGTGGGEAKASLKRASSCSY